MTTDAPPGSARDRRTRTALRGADYAGRAVETPAGVVPVVRRTTPTFWTQVRRSGEATAYPAIAVPRSVRLRLDAPLADRTVLSLQTGVPLPRRDAL